MSPGSSRYSCSTEQHNDSLFFFFTQARPRWKSTHRRPPQLQLHQKVCVCGGEGGDKELEVILKGANMSVSECRPQGWKVLRLNKVNLGQLITHSNRITFKNTTSSTKFKVSKCSFVKERQLKGTLFCQNRSKVNIIAAEAGSISIKITHTQIQTHIAAFIIYMIHISSRTVTQHFLSDWAAISHVMAGQPITRG